MDGERILRVTDDERRADEWQLVLQSQEIAHRVELTPWGWTFAVPLWEAPRAEAALRAFDDENRPAPASSEAAPEGAAWTGLVVAAVLVAFQAVARARGWETAGLAVSARILDGQWWRAVTALLLHADAAHLLGNVVWSVVFVGALARRTGGGVAALLVVLGGALGNLGNAALHGPGHVSLGASTALFACVGALAAHAALVRRPKSAPRDAMAGRRRVLLAVGAAFGLFAMLGTGEGRGDDVPLLRHAHATDVLAHLAGLVAGALVGLPAARLLRRPPRWPAQALAATAAAAIVAVAWTLALR